MYRLPHDSLSISLSLSLSWLCCGRVMDSNSGSLQSSNGDEEYDSRAADSSSFSAFMNPPPQITSSMFYPSLSGYSFDPLSSRSLPNQQNPLLNLDMLIWSKTLRSDPANCTDPPNILPSSPSPPIQTRTAGFQISSPAVQIPLMPENAVRSSLVSSDQNSTCSGLGVVRNSRKRSRASRRAPTTVMNTDTTNFRAMVQEFTGIPAPPFTTSSPFPRTRLDLFSSSTISQPPPYLLRPFAQKLQPPPFVPSSSSTTSSNSTTFNYQLPVVNSELGISNIHKYNHIPSFQSLLQTSPKYLLPNSSILGSRPTNDDFVLGHHGHFSPQLTAVSHMEGIESRRRNNNSANWAGDGVGSNDSGVGDQDMLLRSVNGNYGNPPPPPQQRVTNYLASSSNFHGDRGESENVSTRSEGMVESWICSSD